jgi:hypothetical protein
VPNWCSNRLTIKGDRTEVIKFLEIAGDDNSILADALLAARVINPDNEMGIAAAVIASAGQRELVTFNGHVPQPSFDGDDWYSWRVSNWGTKWDLGDLDIGKLEVIDDSALVEFFFQTAWAAPSEWFVAVAKAHPTLQLQMVWNEEQGFAGIYDSTTGAVSHTNLEVAELESIWPEAPYTGYDEDEEDEEDGALAAT